MLTLRVGDELIFSALGNEIVVQRRHTRLDIAFVRALETTLSEWESAEDDRAYHDL